ncbi:MAG TPA: FtsX-like permease family protein [Acidimicrobiales bacterium]|nr:FtsX-like permease family protein [Acidimicrobiales bacterium]
MLLVTLKGLLAYKLRLALTALAVVLGVSFVSGTYVLTDTITGFFDSTFRDVNKGIDINVTVGDLGGVNDAGGAFSDTERMDGSVLDAVKQVEGVAYADGLVQGFAQMLDKNGKRYGGLGPPTFGFSWGSYAEFSPLKLQDGVAPTGPNDVAIDVVSARHMGYTVGDTVRVILQGPARDFKIVGIVGFGKADNLGGATIVSWSTAVAQQVLQKGTDWDQVSAKVERGENVNDVITRIQDVLADNYKVQTGQAAAQESADAINSSLSIFTNGILFFAGIALFVGAFIIANTFSIIVAQRSRELALLRSIGASRVQIMASVLLEALIVGIVASVIGLVVGLGIGTGLRALVDAFSGGGGLPGSQVGLKPRTIVVGLSVGIITTFLSALVPAVRGSRLPPIAALRQEAVETADRVSIRRVLVGVVAALVAAFTLGYGMYGQDVPVRFAFVGLGAVGVFLGIAMLSPLAVRPVARVLGAPLARTGMPGHLARENSRRNPQRTASTAGALMIGIAVVAAVSTLGSSIDRSVGKVLDRTVKADVILSNRAGTIDPLVEERVKALPAVAEVVPLRINQFRLGDKKRVLMALPPSGSERAFDLEVSSGTAELGDSGVLIHADIASKLHKAVGDSLDMGFPKGSVTLPVKGIYENNQATRANYVISLADFERQYVEQQDVLVFALAKPGTAAAALAHAIEAELKTDFPQIDVLDQSAFAKRQAEQIQGLLAVVNALLMLSIIIALLGIANTLALSVFERTREIGLLRAVGTSRRQTRRMIRYESIIIAVLGAVLGIVLGTIFGTAAVGALRDEGITELVLPILTIVVVLVLAGFAGVLAAIFPARRAANLDVLQAIAAAE